MAQGEDLEHKNQSRRWQLTQETNTEGSTQNQRKQTCVGSETLRMRQKLNTSGWLGDGNGHRNQLSANSNRKYSLGGRDPVDNTGACAPGAALNRVGKPGKRRKLAGKAC
jgi:hypothetical protein